ncbi:MAG: energy transducer TonB [Desulfuromonadales bacterium]
MTSKLTTMPTLFRLSLCLLASAGVHGSVAFYDYDGARHPSTLDDGRSAVVVALVSAADDASFAVVDTPKKLAVQDAAVAAPPIMDRIPDVAPSPPQADKPPDAIPQSHRSVRQATEVVEASAAESLTSEPVCLEPRQGLPAQVDVESKPGETAASPLCEPAAALAQAARSGHPDESLTAAHRDELGQVDGPHGGGMIEAMPNYRNNPLPEYPLIARQRHWQGVVWLLVDVSAKGLVDAVDLEQSCGYRVLDRAARRAVKRWEFTPAKQAGLPVASQVRIPVRFSLEGS